jgi:hypothetical protein
MVDVTGQPGALTGLTLEEESEKPVIYGVYQTRSQTPQMDLSNLQNVYGTSAMPVFNWVRTIQTGTRSYNPNSDSDREMLEEYRRLTEEQGAPPGLPDWSEIGKQAAIGVASQVGQQAASQAGAALFDPYLAGSTTEKLLAGVGQTFGSTPSQLVSSTQSSAFSNLSELPKNNIVVPELANRKVAEATGNLDLFNALGDDAGKSIGDNITSYTADELSKAGVTVDKAGKATLSEGAKGNITSEAITASSSTPTYFEQVGDRLYGTEAAKANWAGAAGAGIINFGVQLAMGEDPEKAAKSAGASAIGTAVGNALLPGIGGVIGGVLGGIVGGRVICNELCRQGMMTRKQVILDYRFTRDYLTPQHVNGYHVWAVWMVKQMRKGKLVNFWKHVACHRANEIAYIYGERDKPDYLGKVYRRIFEPTCWVIGAFCKTTDWSSLYKPKEIL